MRLILAVRSMAAGYQVFPEEVSGVEGLGESCVLKDLRQVVSWRAVPLGLDDNDVALAIQAEQVDETAEFGGDLARPPERPPGFSSSQLSNTASYCFIWKGAWAYSVNLPLSSILKTRMLMLRRYDINLR